MEQGGTGSKRSNVWRWVAVCGLLAVVGLAVAAEVMVARAMPILKGRVIETLSTRFKSKVELDQFNVSLLKGLQVEGNGLRIYPPDDVMAAGATHPLIAIRHFGFHVNLAGLFTKPMHVGTVYVTGMTIDVPPRSMRQQTAGHHGGGKIKVVVDEIICDDSHLLIESSKPGKDPKDFVLQHIEMHEVGPDAPWSYQAILTNAIPKGDIHASGVFGPWQTEEPGESLLTGHYTFDHADLGTIKGIGGTLSSVGDFTGRLDRISVQGTTKTPDFSIDTGDHPLPLETKFEAIVDGTTGDTYLNQVDATLGRSHFTTNGKVVNIKGQGHIVDLDVDVPNGRIEDFLTLAVKTRPAIMTGFLVMKCVV